MSQTVNPTAPPDTAELAWASRSPKAREAVTVPFHEFLAWFVGSFLLSFALVWIYVAAMPMAFLSRDYPLWVAKRTMMAECEPGTVAVFGDSRAVAGIAPGVMQLHVANYAVSGGTPIETFFAVRRMLSCPQPPKLVVIAHSAGKYDKDVDFWASSARNGLLSYDDIRSVEADAERLHDIQLDGARGAPDLPPWLRDAMFAMHFPPLYFSSLVDGFIGLRWWHNQAALHASLESRGQALFGQDPGSASVADEASSDAYNTTPLTDLYFTKTLALLAERDVPLVVLTMPINRATYRLTSPTLAIRFGNYLQDRTSGLSNVLMMDARLQCWSNSYFGDAWHFNQRGAEAYSRVLDKRLQALLAGSADPAERERCE